MNGLDSRLLTGMIEALPEPGTAIPESTRLDWLDTMARVLSLVYPTAVLFQMNESPSEIAELDAFLGSPVSNPREVLKHPEDDDLGVTTVISPTESPKRRRGRPPKLDQSPKCRPEDDFTAPIATPEPPAIRGSGAVPFNARQGDMSAHEIAVAVLESADCPLTLPQIVDAALSKYPGHGFRDLRTALKAALKNGDRNVFCWDFGDRGRQWALIDHAA